MKTAKQLLELYKIYNPQEEEMEGLTPESRQTYDSQQIRNIFIGTILGLGNDSISNLRKCINMMPDEWVLEFIKTVNGDVVEEVNESLNEGMWESPFQKQNLEAIRKLFSKEITAKKLASRSGKKEYWNVIGDDGFWDEINDMAISEPDEDVRPTVAKYLNRWRKQKKYFTSEAWNDEAVKEITKIIKGF